MIIGFTGTQVGMTPIQYARVHDEVIDLRNAQRRLDVPITGSHGDCIGADAQFHRIARLGHQSVHLHPPDDPSKRAFCDYDLCAEPLPYLERNHAIVDECDLLIAAPAGYTEQLRSGTWATVRYAHKVHLPKILVINPDGSTNTDRSTPL